MLSYQRETFRRETVVRASPSARIDEHGLTFLVHLEPGQEWITELQVTPMILRRGRPQPLVAGWRAGRAGRDMAAELQQWRSEAPTLRCDWEPFKQIYERSLTDLAALRFSPDVTGVHSVPAAGLPWFMTMLGRDSILTSLQALPFTPGLAATTIRALSRLQGSAIDDFRDMDPGRILHELRYGESSAFGEQPHSAYYGNADATPLFVVLLDEYERWSGDAALVRRFEHAARAALAWIDEYADLMDNGYISYQRRNEDTGLENQCWKDSWDSISYHDGRLPDFPRATCELQGYAYDAKIRGARLAREFWNDPDYAARLERAAENLKARFNRDFWPADRQYYALALVGADGDRVDALSSNIGHLLWSGIVDEDKAAAVVGHLTSPELYSGWGIRTLATTEGRYNPFGYHVGTVWPFDNSFIAWGFAGTASTRRRPASPPASSTRPPTSMAGYRRCSLDLPASAPDTRSSTPPRAVRKPGPPGLHCCCCAPCWASTQPGKTWSKIQRYPNTSATSNFSTSPAAGAGPTPTAAGRDSSPPNAWRNDALAPRRPQPSTAVRSPVVGGGIPMLGSPPLTTAWGLLLRCDELGEFDKAVGEAPLVVVPGQDLHLAADDLRQRRVEDRRVWVADDVGGDDRRF